MVVLGVLAVVVVDFALVTVGFSVMGVLDVSDFKVDGFIFLEVRGDFLQAASQVSLKPNEFSLPRQPPKTKVSQESVSAL